MKQTKQYMLPVMLKLLIVVGIIFGALILFLWAGRSTKTAGPLKMGVTFSQIYASSLGLDWKQVLTASLDDLGIRHYRIPAYWNVVQPHEDVYDWSSVDYQIDEIAKRQGSVLLAVGLKLPRWPECWMPDWVKALSSEDEHAARLRYVQAAVERYRTHPTLVAWQVENEVDFPFGICPPYDRELFLKELALVRELDPHHPITSTDSGELATWLSKGSLVDALGVSVYRVVRLPWGTVWPYDWIPPYLYHRHALLVSPLVDRVFVSEFQMEPWVEKSPPETPLAEQFETFPIERMQKNFWFAERMQINEIYFWGVEWWYWMKSAKEDARFWDEARGFFTSHE